MSPHPSFAIPARPALLRAETVALRPISDWDIPEILIAHQDDPELAAALGLDRPPTAAQLGREVERAAADWRAGLIKLTVLVPGCEDCRGRLVVDMRDPAPAGVRPLIWIAPGWRGRGLARGALALASDWLSGRAQP
jgi:RimJ/RimL family protein N-acetyltransferase